MGAKSRGALFAVVAAMVVLSVMALLGCSNSYSLTKDAALTSSWGDTVQFKVDSSWSNPAEDESSSNKTICSGNWYNPDSPKLKNHVSVSLKNVNSSIYKDDDSRTYAGWRDSQIEQFSRSAEEQASIMNGLASTSKSKSYTADDFPSFSDCKVEDKGSVSVGGNEVRTYAVTYHYKYSDKLYQDIKNQDQSIKQEGEMTKYCGLIKDGKHDLEVETVDSGLLKDVLSTMEFSW
ncbi:MAG: hypothetical protein SOI38_08715 [Eggerthellaceae bacterium]|jgi:hypothetical protein